MGFRKRSETAAGKPAKLAVAAPRSVQEASEPPPPPKVTTPERAPGTGRYVCLLGVILAGKAYSMGEAITLTDAQAVPLVKRGAVKPAG